MAECREKARNMTIPARGWLLLRRVMCKRPPKHHLRGDWGPFGTQTQAVSSECPLGLEIGPGFRYKGVLGGSKWDMSN